MEWGMSEKLGRVRYKSNEQEVFVGRSVTQSDHMSDETAKLIDEEVRKLVEDGETTARKMIKDNAEQFEAIAQALLEYETLTGDELRELMDGKQPFRPSDDDTPPKGTGVPKAGKTVKKKPKPKADPDGLEPQPES